MTKEEHCIKKKTQCCNLQNGNVKHLFDKWVHYHRNSKQIDVTTVHIMSCNNLKFDTLSLFGYALLIGMRMKRLIDAIIKKWFCCHEWEFLFERKVEVVDDWGDSSWYTVYHYFCKKCGKYKKIKSH